MERTGRKRRPTRSARSGPPYSLDIDIISALSMDAPSSAEVLLQDALTATTRRIRTALLVFSVLGFIMKKTGLVPSKIAGLGIEFTADHRTSLTLIVLLATLYFLVAFVVYALADFSKWQLTLRASYLRTRAIENRAALVEGLDAGAQKTTSGSQDVPLRQVIAQARVDKALQDAMKNYMRPYWQLATPLGWVRAFLDFFFPPLFGVYTVYLLVILVCTI